MVKKYFISGKGEQQGQEPFLKQAFGLAFFFAFGLMFFETCENFFYFHIFFPRGSFFKVVLDSIFLKFTFFPTLKLFFFTALIYVAVFFIASLISVFCSRIFWKKAWDDWGRVIFHVVNLYVFTYLILTYNAVLHPISRGRHDIVYSYLFPHRDELNGYLSVNELLGPMHVFFAAHWMILVLVAAVGIFYSMMVFIRSAERVVRWRIFVVGILGISLVLGYFFYERQVRQKRGKNIFSPDQNIILIGLDSFQYNQLAKEWGALSEPAPDVLKFIRESVYFTDVWTSFARTTPSFAGILTGRFPFRHGIRANLLEQKYEAKDNIYLGDLLRQEGYYSFFAIDDMRFFSLFHRHGFDEFFTPRRDIAGMVLASFYDYALGNILIYHDIAPWIFDALVNNRAITAYNPHVFIKHLTQRLSRLPRQQKKFIVIHLCGNHHPYTAVYPHGRDSRWTTPSERCMAMVNDQFVGLLEYLKESGLYQGSDIYVFSDHGSGWDPRRKLLSHGSGFDVVMDYQRILAIDSPRLNKPKKISTRVRTIDLYPTILDLVGLSELHGDIDGLSLLPLLNGQDAGRPRLVLAETGFSLNFCYSGDFRLQGQQVQQEIRKFKVDPQTGHVFIFEDQYQEILKKKWFMMIMDEWRIIFHPETQTSFLYRADDFQNHPVDDTAKREFLLKKLQETFNRF